MIFIKCANAEGVIFIDYKDITAIQKKVELWGDGTTHYVLYVDTVNGEYSFNYNTQKTLNKWYNKTVHEVVCCHLEDRLKGAEVETEQCEDCSCLH